MAPLEEVATTKENELLEEEVANETNVSTWAKVTSFLKSIYPGYAGSAAIATVVTIVSMVSMSVIR